MLLTAANAAASPVSITMILQDLDGPLHVSAPGTNLLDPANLTTFNSGITFNILVDDTTTDARGDLSDYGRFNATEVRMTASDIGVFNELVITPLGYFEDDALQRAGLSAIGDYTSVQVGLSAVGNSHVGNPNVIETLVDFEGVPTFSIWSTLFEVELASGVRIAADPNSPLVNFGTSSIKAQGVPAPSGTLLLLVGTFLLVVIRRKRPTSAIALFHNQDFECIHWCDVLLGSRCKV